MRMSRGLLIVAGLAGLAAPARAQRVVPPPAIPGAERPPVSDTLRTKRDSAAMVKDTATKANFATPDSTMQRLLALPGYSKTRYEAGTIGYKADSGSITLKTRAMVQTDSIFAKSDQIRYRGGSGVVDVQSGAGKQNVFVTTGQAPIISEGPGSYDLEKRHAKVSNISTSIAQNGENLYLTGEKVAVQMARDSATNTSDAVYYLRDGTVTACADSIPDYYFKAGEIKRTGSFVVARPAVLYIGDVPVMWLPFFFQDVRGGRHSGILAPNVGISDIVRNNPSYRRSVQGLGYYWSISDYLDAQAFFDWRSSAGQTQPGDDGFVTYNGEFRYNWLDRYVDGHVAASKTFRGPDRNTAVSLYHHQEFTRHSKLTANANYVTNTDLQRSLTVNPYQVLSTISSQFNYDHELGPARFTLGGSRQQHPGRSQTDQQFPTISLSTSALDLASWLSWTPSFSYSSTKKTDIDQTPSVAALLTPQKTPDGLRDTLVVVPRNDKSYTSTLSFGTPLQIFGYNLGNQFSIGSKRSDFPEKITETDLNTGVARDVVYSTTYSTDVDWTPSFTLPALGRNRFNLTPSLSFSNVEGGAFWIRNMRTGGRWVHQSKRPSFGLSASPTLYGLFGGFGPFTRIRHSISTTFGYSYAPSREVSDEYLIAIGRSKYNSTTGDATGYLGSLRQNALSFGLSTNLEGKKKAPNDSNPDAGEKIKILSLSIGSMGYDFERARATHSAIRGLTTESISPSLTSDLLPGLQLSTGISLFRGSTVSDSAEFKPFLTNLATSFSFSDKANPFAIFSRLFGRAVVPSSGDLPVSGNTAPPDDPYARQVASQPVAGRSAQRAAFMPTVTQGWQASFNFNMSRQRPISGSNVIDFDPTLNCRFLDTPGTRLAYDQCVLRAQNTPNTGSQVTSGLIGSPVYREPTRSTLSSNLSMNLTEHWAGSINNSYDFQLKQFSSQIVSLQRDLHDWRAIFAFTQAPNGAFAFNFMVSLKAEPEMKFDYHKSTYRSQTF